MKVVYMLQLPFLQHSSHKGLGIGGRRFRDTLRVCLNPTYTTLVDVCAKVTDLDSSP